MGKKSKYWNEQMYYQSQKKALKKPQTKIILEGLQKGIKADSALLEQGSAESTSVKTFSGFLRMTSQAVWPSSWWEIINRGSVVQGCAGTQLICWRMNHLCPSCQAHHRWWSHHQHMLIPCEVGRVTLQGSVILSRACQNLTINL